MTQKIFLGVFGALAAAAVSAQPAVMRLACEGDSLRTEVFVNGKSVGECPIDVQVAPGRVKVQASRRIDERTERSFEDEFTLGAGTAKRVQIVLGAPGPNAEGRRLAALEDDQAWEKAKASGGGAARGYLRRYPNGRHAAEARQVVAALPPRPIFPVAVDEALLDRIETSEAFATMRAARPVRSATSCRVEVAGGSPMSMAQSARSQPAGGYLASTTDSSAAGNNVKVVSTAALLGLLPVASTSGNTQTRLVALDELSGSLVPPRAGAQLRLRYRTQSTAFAMSVNESCVMGPAVPASSLSPLFTGNAWPVDCAAQYATQIAATNQTTNYEAKPRRWLLEDYGILNPLALGTEAMTPKAGVPSTLSGATWLCDRVEFAAE